MDSESGDPGNLPRVVDLSTGEPLGTMTSPGDFPPSGVMPTMPEPKAVNELDEDDDDDLDETLAERLYGLTEMFPERLRSATCSMADFSLRSTKFLYNIGRVGLWVVASSATILALPIMFESERAQMEEQQVQQQRQILLGPNAAMSGGGLAPGSMLPGAMPMPQVSPPPKS